MEIWTEIPRSPSSEVQSHRALLQICLSCSLQTVREWEPRQPFGRSHNERSGMSKWGWMSDRVCMTTQAFIRGHVPFGSRHWTLPIAQAFSSYRRWLFMLRTVFIVFFFSSSCSSSSTGFPPCYPPCPCHLCCCCSINSNPFYKRHRGSCKHVADL